MKFLADENLHGDILRGLMAQLPDLDIVRVQDTKFKGASDEALLEEAANQGAILITHDVRTITKHAHDRVHAGLLMPGVIEIAYDVPIGSAIADLVMLIMAGQPTDFDNQVIYVPFR